MTTSERVPFDILYDIGMLETPPANNARVWQYGKGDYAHCDAATHDDHYHCDHVVDLPINESRLSCPLCAMEGRTVLLRKIFLPTTVQQVWHEFNCMATGRPESDRKKMEQYGRARADAISEELGIPHSFERTDYSELRKEGENTSNRQLHRVDRADQMQEALVSTHDRAVAEGRKESKGRFTF